MEKHSLLPVVIMALVMGTAFAPSLHADEIRFGSSSLAFTFLPGSLQIPLHIASPTEFTTRVQVLSFKDQTMFRSANYYEDGAPAIQDGYYFAIASAFPFFRLHPTGRDDLGIGFQGKFMIPFQTDSSWIAMAMEFTIDLAVTASIHPSFAVSVSRKHICSHLLDRSFFTSGHGFPGAGSSDTDPEHGPMGIRDSVVFSAGFSPEKLLFPKQNLVDTSLYVDYGLSLPGGDPFSDARYTRPSYRTSRYWQYGAQASIRIAIGKIELGSIYAACNFSQYESTGYALNSGYAIGYTLPGPKKAGRVSIDLSYYDGRAVLEEYYGHRERYTSIGLKLLQ